jgi:hypothetical protein
VEGSDVAAASRLLDAIEPIVTPTKRPILRRRLSRMVIVRPSVHCFGRLTSSLTTSLSGPRQCCLAEDSHGSLELVTLGIGLSVGLFGVDAGLKLSHLLSSESETRSRTWGLRVTHVAPSWSRSWYRSS